MSRKRKRQHDRKQHIATHQMPWEDLLEAYTRTGNNYSRKEQVHLEMRARVARGYQGNERMAPARLFHA